MKLTNQKDFEKWCEKKGFRAGAFINDVERWASECDGSFGSRNISYETGDFRQGRPETIDFELVRAELVEVRNAAGKFVGVLSFDEDWSFDEGCYISNTLTEPVYRFRD